MAKKLPAYTVYLVTRGFYAVFFTMMAMISAVYRVQTAGLNPLQLVLVGTVLEATVFLFEIPTGIVADLRSRRLSVIIGYLLIGLGFMVEGAFPTFGLILVAQITWGIGATFTSGAEEAWLADELTGDGSQARLTHVYLRGSQMDLAGTLLGIIISVGLGRLALNLPIFFGGLGIVGLGLFLILFMPEAHFHPADSAGRGNWHKLTATFGQGLRLVRGRWLLMIMMAIGLVYGLSSEGLDRLWEAHFLANFTFPAWRAMDPVTWFGIINVGEIFLVLVATEIVRRRLVTDDPRAAVKLMLTFNGVVVAGLLVFGLAAGFPLAVLSIWTVFTFRRSAGPLYAAWINETLPSEIRATVLSMRGQVDAIGQFIGGPIIGAVATLLSLRAAMVGVGLMLAPAVWLYSLALKHYRQSAEATKPTGEKLDLPVSSD